MPPRPAFPGLIEHADAAGVALFAAAVALPEDGTAPEWVTVFPKVGRVETRDGRAFEVSAAILMAAFTEDAIKIPVDGNHATDAAGLFGGEAPAVGWGVELRERDGGLQLKVEWLDRGREIATLVEGALKERKIVPAQREHLEKLCATDEGLAGVTAMLAATAPGLQPSGLDGRHAPEGRERAIQARFTRVGRGVEVMTGEAARRAM